MTHDEFLRLEFAHRCVANSQFADRMREVWDSAPGGSAGLTLEEWIARFGGVTGLTPYQVQVSRMIGAMSETARPPLGKRLSIRARRRWQGRARAWLRRTA
ncbi:hypothetical protein LPC10_08565 [Methylorubrum sp. B1-46]|uniref:hypothetical protein n=1 Tax=Methylorubrum sp. B1-46 TaxID=2897334 RepID=UPI001E33AF26|nr:hypothetical protein [Methylorubrum sp. B1-46]UGB27601.1 hypothetical protein LPC10_08565 [Methylorubrum sp. B1-46]